MGKKKKTLVGYDYILGMHMVLSHPIDALLRIDAGEKTILSGNWTSNTSVSVFLPELFGGQLKEGGIAGTMDFCFGADTQPQNAYLVEQLGADVPAFRGVFSVVLNRMWLTSMSQYIKPWQFLVQRIPGRSWYNAKANINDGSANAAHIIYDCFTNQSWGLGYPTSVLDLASFQACADVLYSEGLGLSFILSSTDTIESFMQEVCKHVAGTLYNDPATGRFVMGLLRDDYNPAALNLYDPSNIISLESLEKPSPAEMVNEVVIKYRPRGTSSDDSVTAQDLASIQSQGGVISTTIDYAGIDNADNAGRIAARELRQRSTPLTRVKFVANREAWRERIGGVIRFSWPEHNVANMVLRIVGINFGTLDKSAITITAIEDVFGLPYAQYLKPQPSQWVNPIQAPSQLSPIWAQELSYWDINRNFDPADVALIPTSGGYMGGAAGAPAQASPNFEYWTAPSNTTSLYSKKDIGAYSPYCLTTAPANRIQTTIAVGSVKGNLAGVTPGTYGVWQGEYVRFDSYNSGTGIIALGRGVLDSVPAEHPTASTIMWVEAGMAMDTETFWTPATVWSRFLMRTGDSLFPIASATGYAVAVASRQMRPYPPAKFRLANHVGAQASPTKAVDWYGTLAQIGWDNRNRVTQLATLNDQQAGNMTIEPGTTTTIRFFDLGASTTLATFTGLTGNQYNYSDFERSVPRAQIRITAWTSRTDANGTFASTSSYEYDVTRHGMGFNLGNELGGVA